MTWIRTVPLSEGDDALRQAVEQQADVEVRQAVADEQDGPAQRVGAEFYAHAAMTRQSKAEAGRRRRMTHPSH